MAHLSEALNSPEQSALRRGGLALLMACALLGASRMGHAEDLKLGGTGSATPVMQRLAEAFNKTQPGLRIIVEAPLGSSGGIKAVVAGALQIAVSSRPVRDKERAEGAIPFEYGRTPFVFATHAATKAGSLTSRELVDIYAGRLEKWPDGTRLRMVLRPAGDSDTEYIQGMSAEIKQANLQAMSRPGMLVAVTDHDSVASIEKVPGALGTTTLSMIVAGKLPLKALTFDNAVPSAKNIASGSYPHFKRMYLVTGPRTPPAAHKFIAFVQSPAGQDILRSTEHWLPAPGEKAHEGPRN